jgi:hypothetical protein
VAPGIIKILSRDAVARSYQGFAASCQGNVKTLGAAGMSDTAQFDLQIGL